MSPSAAALEPVPRSGTASRATALLESPAAPSLESYRREVTPGFASVEIAFDAPTGTLGYLVNQPSLTDSEARALGELDRALPRILPPTPTGPSGGRIEEILRSTISEYLRLHYPELTGSSVDRILYYRRRDAFGFGVIDPILNDPEIEDISCDGAHLPIFVQHARFESLRTNLEFSNEEALRGFVVHLAQRCGRSISVARPLLDGVTREGHRVQATFGHEVTGRGSGFTIRRFRDRPFTPLDLLRTGTASPELVAHLWLAVEQGDSLIICGGPAAGKTSTLNALSLFLPRSAKVVSIEDTRELSLLHEHWVPSTTRSGSGAAHTATKAAGEIDMYDLLTAALRQRPSHILVGEVRGPEAVTMFQAMATGHATYATMHADSVRGMVARLESPPIRVPRAFFGSLRQVLIQVQRKTPSGTVRRLAQLVEIGGLDSETDEIVTSPVFDWDPGTDGFHYQGHSLLVDRAAARRGCSPEDVERDLAARSRYLRAMVAEGVTDPRTIHDRIEAFRSMEVA